MEETGIACPTHGRDSIAETSSEDQYTLRCILCDYKYTAHVTRNGDEINYHGQANFTIHQTPVDNFERKSEGILTYQVNNEMDNRTWLSLTETEEFKKSVISDLEFNDVFSIVISSELDTVKITEACDDTFYIELNKERLLSLIKELKLIADQMTPRPDSSIESC